MRIGIDGYNLALPFGTGVATYSMALAHAVQSMDCELDGLYGLRTPFKKALRDINFFEALGAEFQTRPPRHWTPAWLRELSGIAMPRKVREIGIRGKTDVRQFGHRLPDFDRLFTVSDLFDQSIRNFRRFGTFTTVKIPNPPEVMHWTYPLPVRVAGARNIYTIHDLVPLKLPFASLDNKRFYQKLMRACILRGDQICTVSEASKADILDFFPEAEGRVTNTYQAIKPSKAAFGEKAIDAAELSQSLKSIFRLDYQDYFLFFGAIEPKKNVGRLIEAYLASGARSPLVVVGRRAWGADVELSLIQRDETQPMRAVFKNIRRIDYLPKRLLVQLIRGAKAVTFPSLYEGFGLPVLEAMSEGAPVITSNTSSLPEVAGNAAMLVDPYDVSAIAHALKTLDGDAAMRQTMMMAGLEQAENFSMQVYRDRLSRMYAAVLAQEPR
jgi:glycosyltransferase involved in cell wall biosynthesis